MSIISELGNGFYCADPSLSWILSHILSNLGSVLPTGYTFSFCFLSFWNNLSSVPKWKCEIQNFSKILIFFDFLQNLILIFPTHRLVRFVNTLLNIQCKFFQLHKSAWPFMEPVDPEEAPDYYNVVKEPMGKLRYYIFVILCREVEF